MYPSFSTEHVLVEAVQVGFVSQHVADPQLHGKTELDPEPSAMVQVGSLHMP
jgi:hypothetical protein